MTGERAAPLFDISQRVQLSNSGKTVVIASASEAIHRAAKEQAGLLRRKCSSQ
jgi:hypothetical protein